MLKIVRINTRGDTIIEVLLAMSLLSMIIFIAWGTTNRATQISTNARKRVVMVNALKEQAEIIKSRYKQLNGDPTQIVESVITSASLPADPCESARLSQDIPTIGGAYHFDTSATSVEQASTNYRSVEGDSTARVWFQYVTNPADDRYVDFYVRGCWLSVGGNQREENSQFIVRLNK